MGKSSTKSDIASKADRKFEKKVQFYSKVRDSVASLSATKGITKKKKQRSRRQRQKLKAFDLSALSEFLPELKEKEKENLKVNCRNRTKIMVEEVRRMNEFHMDPDFQKDPFAFIDDLLKNRYPEEEKVKKKNVKKDGKKKKKKNSSASGAPLAMEV